MFELGQSRKTAAIRTSKCVCFFCIGDSMDKFMIETLKEAKKAYKKNEVPIGAIIVKDNKIIARAYNKKEKNNIATHHAEILAINKACRKIKNWRLNDCTLYVTVEPCVMCCGAIVQSRIKKVVYGISNKNYGGIESIATIFDNTNISIEKGIMQEECLAILQKFFNEKRN